jgi:hypothetical protein
LRRAPRWQRWTLFYALTGVPALAVFSVYGFWWALLVELLLAWPQDVLLNQLVLRYPMPKFLKRLENKGKAMRAGATIAQKPGKRW